MVRVANMQATFEPLLRKVGAFRELVDAGDVQGLAAFFKGDRTILAQVTAALGDARTITFNANLQILPTLFSLYFPKDASGPLAVNEAETLLKWLATLQELLSGAKLDELVTFIGDGTAWNRHIAVIKRALEKLEQQYQAQAEVENPLLFARYRGIIATLTACFGCTDAAGIKKRIAAFSDSAPSPTIVIDLQIASAELRSEVTRRQVQLSKSPDNKETQLALRLAQAHLAYVDEQLVTCTSILSHSSTPRDLLSTRLPTSLPSTFVKTTLGTTSPVVDEVMASITEDVVGWGNVLAAIDAIKAATQKQIDEITTEKLDLAKEKYPIEKERGDLMMKVNQNPLAVDSITTLSAQVAPLDGQLLSLSSQLESLDAQRKPLFDRMKDLDTLSSTCVKMQNARLCLGSGDTASSASDTLLVRTVLSHIGKGEWTAVADIFSPGSTSVIPNKQALTLFFGNFAETSELRNRLSAFATLVDHPAEFTPTREQLNALINFRNALITNEKNLNDVARSILAYLLARKVPAVEPQKVLPLKSIEPNKQELAQELKAEIASLREQCASARVLGFTGDVACYDRTIRVLEAQNARLTQNKTKIETPERILLSVDHALGTIAKATSSEQTLKYSDSGVMRRIVDTVKLWIAKLREKLSPRANDAATAGITTSAAEVTNMRDAIKSCSFFAPKPAIRSIDNFREQVENDINRTSIASRPIQSL